MRAAGEATRERILVATLKELVTYGPGGARVNRIATSARASTERLYAYFPSKGALFAAAIDKVMSDATSELEMTGDDLPGYAGRLFDLFVSHPEYARMDDWLGDQPDANDRRVKTYQPKIDEIRQAQAAGHINPDVDPVSLFHAVHELSRSMAHPGPAMTQLAHENAQPDAPETRRRTVVELVTLLATPRDAQADVPGGARAEEPGRTRADVPAKAQAQDPGKARAQEPGKQRAQDPGKARAQEPGRAQKR
ncbi:TetR family transcriptional regulator [Actinoplanes sp. TBRC 11911]|uniref:TetR family transcriptional regulator n=1 Tax=Actinoplanes sp. TBRC 11911 TaxID=2729386 RepID=UPI00145C4F65|nr:TetR family transcriptional regulator [Actinoplanes sp. TBRC 11911]NMO56095.1 TetR family transcriptional regulator [Actinoplanes sp. TBRC 11911]